MYRPEGKAEGETVEKLDRMVKLFDLGEESTRRRRGSRIRSRGDDDDDDNDDAAAKEMHKDALQDKRMLGFKQWRSLVMAEVQALAFALKALETINSGWLLGTVIEMLKYRRTLIDWEELLWDNQKRGSSLSNYQFQPRYRLSIRLFNHCVSKMPLHFHAVVPKVSGGNG